jgi:hypothetical protein
MYHGIPWYICRLRVFRVPRPQPEPRNRFSRLLAQNACFGVMKCLLGVWLKFWQVWGRGAPKASNFRPRNANSPLKRNPYSHEIDARQTKSLNEELLGKSGSTFRICHCLISTHTHTPMQTYTLTDTQYNISIPTMYVTTAVSIALDSSWKCVQNKMFLNVVWWR